MKKYTDMKKLAIIFILLAGIAALTSCKKQEKDPVLDMSQTVLPVLLEPEAGTALVLDQDNADSVISFKWSAAEYNLDNVENPKYSLVMDTVGNNFADAVELVNTTELIYETTIGNLNQMLLANGFPAEEESTVEFRVTAYLNADSDYSLVNSASNSVAYTPYSEELEAKPIYLLGSGTTVGWDNVNALEMTSIGEGVYAIVETLTPGADQFIKFISVAGQWAPQWGTDDAGTAEAGNLVYRPTEEVEDPAAIPVGETAGNYYIEADTINLTYRTLLTSGELYLLGAGTPVGWDNAAALPFTQDPDTATKFTIVTTLNTSGGMKFIEVLGQWAPQWGSYDGTMEGGTLAYREDESVPDPPEIPAPGDGEFMITVDLRKMEYYFTPQ